jgi:hypothetical protein
MRALTRMRTLAAACALLLVVSGTAMAGLGNRFIDRTGLPESPPMVGDPDQPTNGMIVIYQYWLAALRAQFTWARTPIATLPASPQRVSRMSRSSRANHAR